MEINTEAQSTYARWLEVFSPPPSPKADVGFPLTSAATTELCGGLRGNGAAWWCLFSRQKNKSKRLHKDLKRFKK